MPENFNSRFLAETNDDIGTLDVSRDKISTHVSARRRTKVKEFKTMADFISTHVSARRRTEISKARCLRLIISTHVSVRRRTLPPFNSRLRKETNVVIQLCNVAVFISTHVSVRRRTHFKQLTKLVNNISTRVSVRKRTFNTSIRVIC